MVIDHEAADLCMAALNAQCLPGTIYEINVDSILYRGPAYAPDGWRCELTDQHRLVGSRQVHARQEPGPPDLAPWVDVDEEAAFAHVLGGGILYVEAHAGTGKSHFLRTCADKLRRQSKEVQCCALTHVATANMRDERAQTLARLSHSYGGRRKIDVLIIDEMSQIDAMLWCHLASICHRGAKLIAAGSWCQLGPVCDQLLNTTCPSMQGRDFLRKKCGYRLRLETCRRSDPRLFAFYTSIASSAEDVSVWVQRAKEAFPPIEGPSPINLVSSHERRKSLNAELQELYKPANAIWVPAPPSTARHNEPQSMWL